MTEYFLKQWTETNINVELWGNIVFAKPLERVIVMTWNSLSYIILNVINAIKEIYRLSVTRMSIIYHEKSCVRSWNWKKIPFSDFIVLINREHTMLKAWVWNPVCCVTVFLSCYACILSTNVHWFSTFHRSVPKNRFKS